MQLSKAISKIHDTKWSMVNNFTIQINNDKLSSVIREDIGVFDQDELNLSLVNIQTPDFANTLISSFIANGWRFHTNYDNLYTMSLTFRDKNQMELYRKFLKLYESTKDQYFDDVKFEMIIYKDPDWYGEEQSKFMILESCIITDISNIDFNTTTASEIAEFKINVACAKPIIQ